MSDSDIYDDFVKISKYLGSNSSYVQGGGGNTSAKLKKNRMLVKASGLLLQDVTRERGFANVDYQVIRTYLENTDVDENLFNSNIILTNSEKDFRPSMETGFHAVLGNFAIHSHSVFANVLNCSAEGPSIMKRFFPNAAWVPYSSPGRGLTLAVQKNLNKKVFFLGNHGLIVQARTADAAIETHENINKKLYAQLRLPKFEPNKEQKFDRDFMNKNILFPDQVIYTNPASNFEGSDAQLETLAAYKYIHGQIKRLGLTPHYLKKEDALYLLNMDAEKHRAKVLN